MPLIVILSSVTALLIIPDVAFAWGPAAHLEIGEHILKGLSHVAPHVRHILAAHPYDFLYGNISADIVVAKNLVRELKHCHNWKVGFRLLKNADNDAQRAFAYGYLCHLASDTVAHNHYIPEMMIRSFSARTLRHIYWELRFDALVDRAVWRLPKKIAKEAHPGNDILLDATIEETPLSFRTNKTIFSSIMTLNRLNQWHRMIRLLSSRSRWLLSAEEKERFLRHSVESSTDVLKCLQNAGCLKKDPTGRHTISAAMYLRKKLKTNYRHKKDWDDAMKEALDSVRVD